MADDSTDGGSGGLTVYGLGDHGVNTSADPLHTTIGDVVSAQNASFFGSGQRGGLAKRRGMRVLATGLNGAVQALLSVTLTDPTPGSILTDDSLDSLSDSAFFILTE